MTVISSDARNRESKELLLSLSLSLQLLSPLPFLCQHQKNVISTGAAHSLIVGRAVEKSAVAVACSFLPSTSEQR
jgi:hypothetical protein